MSSNKYQVSSALQTVQMAQQERRHLLRDLRVHCSVIFVSCIKRSKMQGHEGHEAVHTKATKDYSVLRLSTGFVFAAFKVCDRIVDSPKPATTSMPTTTSRYPTGFA